MRWLHTLLTRALALSLCAFALGAGRGPDWVTEGISGGSGGPPPAGGSNAWTDDFERTASGNISTGAPDPPGTYTETEPNSGTNCTIEVDLNGDLLFDVDHNVQCDNALFAAIGDANVGTDMCVLFEWGDSNGTWAVGSPQIILRAESGLGTYYGFRCADSACSGIRPLVYTAGSVDGSTGFDEALCDDEISNPAVGEWMAACVTGTGATTTRFRIWHFATDPSTDPSTWGTPECDQTPSTGTRDDSGQQGGVGALTTGGTSNGAFWEFDELTVTDSLP